ncbi:UvrD-helicase domain-containing protein [Halobaculum sp. MBLA0147]|uniref:UvrD-helicase domain-containing protein n=1 Tax=Halobaculum sp. MBLA0147 TaxID=3079934 RepID=UPI0035254EF0
MTDAEPAAGATRPPLNDAQREIVDAALAADAGLFVQASVPGSGKTYASSRLCAEFLLERAAAGIDRPAAGLAVMAFNRDAAANLQPEVTDWLRYLVATDATPAARSLEVADVSRLASAFRRSETVGTIDALLAHVFRDIALELGFDDPTVDAGHAVDRLHRDAFEVVCGDPALTDEIERLGDAYPPEDDDRDELDRVADLLETITKTARDHGWTPSEVRERLHESRRAFYPDGPPSSLADVIDDARRFAGDGAGVSPTETWSEDEIVAADRALHDAWAARIDDLVAVYRSYVAAYDRACRERDVVSHVDCAHWIRQYFGDSTCPHRWADDAVSESVVDRRRTRLRDRWQNRVDLLVVDEAQDISTGQHDALAQLVTDDTRVVLYGDPFQSIYTWRNARPSSFAGAITDGTYFDREWDTHVVRKARTTYRQRPALTDTVDSVFGPALDDPGRGDAPSLDVDYDPLSPDRDATDDPRLHLATYRPRYDNDDDHQAEVLAQYLRGALEEGVFDDGDSDAVTDDDAVASEHGDSTGTRDDRQPPIRVLFRSESSMGAVRDALTDVGLTVGTAVPVFEQPLTQTIVSLLEWLVDPLAVGATDAIRDAAATAHSDTLTAVADYVDDAGWGTADRAGDTALDGDAARLFTELRTLATDTAERARCAPSELVERLCRVLAVDDDPFGIQPDSTVRHRRRIRDELRAAAADADGPEVPPSSVVSVLTALCDDPDDGPSLAVDPDEYDVVFETIHSFKGAETQVVALGDPASDPTGWSYTDSVVARGTTLAVCPPATTDASASAHVQRVPVNGYGGGLFDYESERSSRKDSGLRWVTNRSRTDSKTTFVGPERFAKCAAEERAEHWRLGYVAATRPRDHLVVPVPRQSDPDPSDSWAAAFAHAFSPKEADVQSEVTRRPAAADRLISVSIDDVAARDPLESLSGPWTGRSPSSLQLPTYDSTAQDWLPRFVDASTFFPLSEDHDQYVVDHLLGRQLDTDSGTTDTDAPLGVVGPSVLGQIAHDTFGSLIRSDPDCDRVRAGHADITNHVDWALDRARLKHGLDDTQRNRIRDYLFEAALPAFVATDAFERLCRAGTVFVEEPLETRIKVDDLRVEFRGQADFVARDGDEWLIEDIKLTFAEGSAETDDRYRHQLAAYRWILERQGVDPSARVVARITNIGERNNESELSPEIDVDERIRQRLRRLGPE